MKYLRFPKVVPLLILQVFRVLSECRALSLCSFFSLLRLLRLTSGARLQQGTRRADVEVDQKALVKKILARYPSAFPPVRELVQVG